jgi:GNAT superfamily N-acetyltransferase
MYPRRVGRVKWAAKLLRIFVLRGDSMSVTYLREPDLTPDEFIDVLVRSTLAERRPVHDLATIRAMLKNADVILTARLGGLLVGVSRAVTDFAFCTYLSDLAVDEKHQRQGIGRELIRRTHEAAGLHTTLILLAAPKAEGYYPHIGMTKHESCWVIPRQPRPE